MSRVDQMTVENLVEWQFDARVLRVLEDAIGQAKRRNQPTFVRVIWPSESFDLPFKLDPKLNSWFLIYSLMSPHG